MTLEEKILANELMKCSFLPGSFDKKFVKQLPNWYSKPMTQKGKKTLVDLFHKYKRQISDYKSLCDSLDMLQKK